MLRARCVVLACVASCGVRAPAPVDVDALLRDRGPLEARRDLVIRVTSDPRDVAGWLALAALDEQVHRPSDAIAALEAVIALGGPLGVRWRPADQARLARLIAARGRARLTRGAASALADLLRARNLGAAVGDEELRSARVAGAVVALRHSDAEMRETGRRLLAELSRWHVASGATDRDASEAWLGARPEATAEQRGRFGVWLWEQGARRAAWDELSAWRAMAALPRGEALDEAYLVAARWWMPLDEAAAPPGELRGPMRCAFVACAPREIAGDEARERAYGQGPLPLPVREPADAAALAIVALHQALRGEVSWGAALAARLDLAALAEPGQLAVVPAFARPIIARLVGAEPVPVPPDDGASADQRLVIAGERVLAGAGPAEIAGLEGPYAEALRTVAVPRAPFAGDARVEAVTRHARQGVAGAASAEALRAIAAGFARDPAIADRLAADAVAGADDAAAMHAALGALFDAIGDPARARAAWQAAVDASPEAAFLRGLAEAEARQGDADAALIAATAAAAASGDPAVVWAAVARDLDGAGRHVHALDAARSAIDLAGPDTLAAALEVAAAASRALGRDAQATALAARRARIAPAGGSLGDRDPTDARAALAAHRRRQGAASVAALWVASRWNPRDIEIRAALLAATSPGDPRRAAIIAELVELAGDRDVSLGQAAAAALR